MADNMGEPPMADPTKKTTEQMSYSSPSRKAIDFKAVESAANAAIPKKSVPKAPASARRYVAGRKRGH